MRAALLLLLLVGCTHWSVTLPTGVEVDYWNGLRRDEIEVTTDGEDMTVEYKAKRASAEIVDIWNTLNDTAKLALLGAAVAGPVGAGVGGTLGAALEVATGTGDTEAATQLQAVSDAVAKDPALGQALLDAINEQLRPTE